ncbi:hypothetical protein MKX01_001936, partial [Papaver californicum]
PQLFLTAMEDYVKEAPRASTVSKVVSEKIATRKEILVIEYKKIITPKEILAIKNKLHMT